MANLQKLIDVMLSQGGVDLSNYYTKASLYTRDECDARFAPKGSGSSDLSRYLLKTEAASTYLTQSNAQGTYATRVWAQGQFLTQSAADDRYQLKGSGGQQTVKTDSGSWSDGTTPDTGGNPSFGTVSVYFNSSFTQPPAVTLSNSNTQVNVCLMGVSTSGFQIGYMTINGGAQQIQGSWNAVGI